jgi:hypothetical protein
MLLFAVASLATAPALSPTPATMQATATIRVLQAVRLRLDAATNPGAPATRDAVVRLADGTNQPARLIEFQ